VLRNKLDTKTNTRIARLLSSKNVVSKNVGDNLLNPVATDNAEARRSSASTSVSARSPDTTTATEFLPDLAKGGAAFRKIGVIGTRQERAEVFSRDADTRGVQLVSCLYHLYPCSVSP
jgi:hypothetical protein